MTFPICFILSVQVRSDFIAWTGLARTQEKDSLRNINFRIVLPFFGPL
ncbi:hypothetical protein LptCag_1423 [Leptospirillum ferriphilum]|uniref:Uncharacterized protein n=1 Tax=Leptospirillum ferriphilum TaxID=178606 RepID=A0A094W878_9BACT|nr:hypothetical protein LptCag_1423 [Leptospirillum ferriphilum]